MYFQAGDCLLKEYNKPTAGVELDTDVFYKGMNHLHRLRGKFKIIKENEDIFIHSEGCEAFHDEHKAIPLPPGIYKLSIVSEFDHLLEESRAVID